MVTRAALLFAVALAGCAPARAPEALPHVMVQDEGGRPRDLRAEIAASDITVVTFFSAHCPCQRAHDARLRSLFEAYRPRGVSFFAIDAEASASPARDAEEARRRAYPYPIWTNAGGSAADALGVEFATYTVIVDRAGRVRYAGGIDSDRSHLTDDATPYVKDAIDDLLAGRDPRTPRGKVLGCALER